MLGYSKPILITFYQTDKSKRINIFNTSTVP